MNEPNFKSDPLIKQLGQLSPAASNLDARECFYRAGFEAGRARSEKSLRTKHRAVGIVAALLAFIAAVPASFLAGVSTASRVNQPIRSQDGFDTSISDPAISDPAISDLADSQLRDSSQLVAGPSQSGGLHVEDGVTRDDGKAAVVLTEQKRTSPFADWITPLATLARSARLDRQAAPTLTMSHASLVLLNDSTVGLANLPIDWTSTSRVAAGTSSEAELPEEASSSRRQTWAAGDLQVMSLGVEQTR